MLSSLGNHFAYQEALRLLKRLERLGREWHTDPALRSLSPHVVKALLERFETEKQTLLPKTPDYGMLTLVIVYMLVMLVLTMDSRHKPSSYFAWLLGPVLFIALHFISNCAARVWGTKEVHYPLYALTQTDDMRVLPTLILATRYQWGRHPRVLTAIARLLEHVTEEHVGLLNDDAQQRLWTIGITRATLYSYHYHDITLRTLRALAAVGNQATLIRMKRLVFHKKFFTTGQYVSEVAQELIPVMEARFQRQQVPGTLLRAADMPTSQPDTLLRPTFATTPEPADQLLRAARSEPGETQA